MALHVTKKLRVLGCVFFIKSHTIHPDPSKVKALSELPFPATQSKMKSFLRSYQIMISTIHDSAVYLAQLYRLTRGKPGDFKFDDSGGQAFRRGIEIALNPSNFIY